MTTMPDWYGVTSSGRTEHADRSHQSWKAAPGRRAIDERILFSLWLCATLDGVGSGRKVGLLTQEHEAYGWICGGLGGKHSFSVSERESEPIENSFYSRTKVQP